MPKLRKKQWKNCNREKNTYKRDYPKYTQIGNAVPPKGLELVVKELKKLFMKEYQRVNLYEINNFLKSMPLKVRLKVDSHEQAVLLPELR